MKFGLLSVLRATDYLFQQWIVFTEKIENFHDVSAIGPVKVEFEAANVRVTFTTRSSTLDYLLVGLSSSCIMFSSFLPPDVDFTEYISSFRGFVN